MDDIRAWEADHGPLPEGGWLLVRSGWGARSSSQEEFLNADEAGSHTPGLSPACARWLAEESPMIGLGVETVGTDAGAADDTRRRLGAGVRWRDHPMPDRSTPDRIDPRTLTMALDDLLPAGRVVGVDSGNFMGHPSMYLSVPDEDGFCFTQAFRSIGLGLATTIGCAIARPDRLPVAALGDGGGLMGIAEFETVGRLGLPMVIVVHNDEACGADVHHFGPDGHDLDTVEFPPTDIAAIARGHGFDACTVRGA